MIIDSHTHLTKTDDESDFSVGLKRLLSKADNNGVDKIVVIADSEPNTITADTKSVIDNVGDNDRFYVIGSPNVMNDDDNGLPYIEELLEAKKIIGMKLFPGHESFYPTDKRCEPVYELAMKYDCPVVIHTGINSGDFDCAKYNDPKYIVEVAKKYPKLRVVIAHYFWPEMDYCFDLTIDVPNIFYDTSAMADDEVVELSGGIEKVANVLERTAKVKPGSVIFGSDSLMCDQKQAIELIERLDISETERKAIFSTNFEKCFSIQN